MNDIPLRAHLKLQAKTAPDRPAAIIAETGERIDFATLDARSNRIAHLFRETGLGIGSGVAVLMDNSLDFFSVAWAAQRAGLYFTAVSTKLTLAEAEFIVGDSGAAALFASVDHEGTARQIAKASPDLAIFITGPAMDVALDGLPTTPVEDEAPGADMLYSSGTTGRPKGIRSRLPEGEIDAPSPLIQILSSHYGIGPDTIYLSAGPLYHAAPLRWSMGVQALGGTVVVLNKFDAEAALRAIETYRANASQWVPTHFVRMLKLPEALRASIDISSIRMAIHAAAPCPVEVKREMLKWWGPVLHEYYAGTENFGFTTIGPEEWLARPGSVGRALASEIRICDPDGEPLPIGQTGDVFFKSDVPLAEYHGDPAKTQESRNRYGWATYGDIGRIDEAGFLFLSDRRHFTIISGGVNIYPQEIEDVLILHPKVSDVAVIGVPDAEMGERVVAVVEPTNWADANEALANELRAFARERMSGVKVPRQVDFSPELPRQATGKLFKRLIRDQYLKDQA
jgi:long-chain acyl-CoA synthetase